MGRGTERWPAAECRPRLEAARWPAEQGRGVHTVFRPGLKTHPWDPVIFLLPVCQPDERTQQRAWRPSDGRVTRRKDPGSTGVCVEQSAPQPARPAPAAPAWSAALGGTKPSPAATVTAPFHFRIQTFASLIRNNDALKRNTRTLV